MEAVAITIQETVRVTGLSRTTIYKLIRERRLQSVAIGTRRLVMTKSIHGLFDSSDEQGSG